MQKSSTFIFLFGVGVGCFAGYFFTKKKYDEKIAEYEDVISDIRRKNRDYKEELRSCKDAINLVSDSEEPKEDYNTITKHYKSLEEDSRLKKDIFSHIKIISEEEFDELFATKEYDREVIEHHMPDDTFTYENGESFSVFDDAGVSNDISEASQKADYTVGSFVVDCETKTLYEIVRVDDISDEEEKVDSPNPFLISKEKYEKEREEYEKIELTYFKDADRFEDEMGIDIDEPEVALGEEHYINMENGDVVYIRSDTVSTDYKVVCVV